MSVPDFRKIADFFNALSHPVRVNIVMELLNNKKCVDDIRELVNVRQPNVSQHLSVLKSCGIVECYPDKKTKCYFLKNPQLMKDILNAMKTDKIHYFK